MKQQLSSAQAGFTIIEILITLSVMLVLFGIAVASSAYAFRRPGILRESTALKTTIERAYLHAVQFGVTTKVILKRDGYSIHYVIPPGKKRPGRAHDVATALPPTLRLDLRSPPETIVFYPSGVVSPRTITIAAPKNSCALTLSLRGRITRKCIP